MIEFLHGVVIWFEIALAALALALIVRGLVELGALALEKYLAYRRRG